MLKKTIDRLIEIRRAYKKVLTMNRRNLGYVYPGNPRRFFELADNKLATKTLLDNHNIPHSPTLHAYSNFIELEALEDDLNQHDTFVIKPAHGRAGGGIRVIREKTGHNLWLDIKGREVSLEDIRKHISDIIFGVYGFGMNDCAIIEETIIQHDDISRLCNSGLADVRIITHRDHPVIAMTRLPTRESAGRANLHQGAVGAGIDIDTGIINGAVWHGHRIETHPDSKQRLPGTQIPFWDEVMDIGLRTARACPLKYLGLDVALGRNGPLVIEINARPGLTIQSANLLGMRPTLDQIRTGGDML